MVVAAQTMGNGVVAGDTGADLSALIREGADRNGLPIELLVALAIAESELRVQAERWGRHTARARAALAAEDHDALRGVVEQVERETPGDISFGLFQQTVRWADEGDHSSSLENIFLIRDLYYDPAHATAVAGRKLGAFWRKFGDPLEALCRYNKPALAGADNPHRARHQESLERARALLSRSEGDDGGVAPAPDAGGTGVTPVRFDVEVRPSPNRNRREPRRSASSSTRLGAARRTPRPITAPRSTGS